MMGEERVTTARRDLDDDGFAEPLSRRAIIIVLVATLTLSGCVAGTLARQRTWDRDPSPFWVVIRDDGKCTVVFDTVLMDDHRANYLISTFGPPSINCEPTLSSSRHRSQANVYLSGGLLEKIDLSEPKRSRRGPTVIYEDDWTELNSSRTTSLSSAMSLAGSRLGQSTFCAVIGVRIKNVRFVYNAGVNHDVHVFLGEGTRSCSL